MSNPILQSAQSSAVVATLRESDTVTPWVYNEKGRIVSPHAMSILNTPKSSGSVGASSTVSFDISKNGLLCGCYLKLSMPAQALEGGHTQGATEPSSSQAEDADAAANATSGDGFAALGILGCIDEVTLQTSGRALETLTRHQILARYSDLPLGKRQAIQDALRMAKQPEDEEAYECVIWLPFYFWRDPLRYGYNTSFCEPMRCDVKFTACNIFYDGSADAFAAHVPTDAVLLTHYRQLDARDEDQLVSSNFGDGLLSQAVSIMKREATKAIDSVTTSPADVTIDLKENHCVSAIYVIVCSTASDLAKTTYTEVLNNQDRPLEVKNIKLEASGTTVFNVPGDMLKYYGRWGEHNGEGSGIVTNTSLAFGNIYKIDFTTGEPGHTNTVALRELSGARLTLNFGNSGINGKAAEVHVMYEATTFLSTASATGRVQLSISS